MPGMKGTVKTPFGQVQKKTGLIVGGVAVVILGVAYYRIQQQRKLQAVAASGTTDINPATGYPYGSPQDAAAMANQSAYQFPNSGGGAGGGPSSGYPSGVFSNNSQWVQAVIAYMSGNGLVDNPALLSDALGKYITGAAVNDEQKSLINQAIAVQGFPPVGGPAGYPPSINTAPVTTTPPPVSAGKLPAPTGFHDEGPLWTFALVYHWDPVPGAAKYRVRMAYTNQTLADVEGNGWQRNGLVHNGTYFTEVAAVDPNGVVGEWSPMLTSHTKN